MTKDIKKKLQEWAKTYHCADFIQNDPVQLHDCMGTSPYQYVLSRRWEKDFPAEEKRSFYRMLSYADFYSYFERLYAAYSRFESLEEALQVYSGLPIEKLCAFLEVSSRSPLDTHVCRVARLLELTETETFSLKNAQRITAALAEVFPDDPCYGDFALFGYGVNNK